MTKQGHALSVLSRAYHTTDKAEYLEAAIRGLELFEKVCDSLEYVSGGF